MIAMQRSGNGIRGDRCNESLRVKSVYRPRPKPMRLSSFRGGHMQNTEWPRQPYLSQRAACAPGFPCSSGDCAPSALWKGTGVCSSCNRTFVQFGLDTLKSPV